MDAPIRYFAGRDGARLAYRESGSGPPVVLLHGFLAAGRHWIEFGHAARLVAAGHRVVLPDLRGHGNSTRSHDPQAYPQNVLVDDGIALVEHLGLVDYVLGGYSLGGRVVLQMLTRAARPLSAVVAGQGLAAVTKPAAPDNAMRSTLRMLAQQRTPEAGSGEAAIAQWIDRLGADPQALLLVLDSLAPTPTSELQAVPVPVLVVAGDADIDSGDSGGLASAIRGARLHQIPGDHWTAFSQPALMDSIIEVMNPGAEPGSENISG